jgi:excinuclease ABC subunit C
MERLRKKAAELPLTPGVYIMMDKTGKVIYVGKARKLKNRVSSYFHGSHNAKTEAMVSNVADFDVIMATSEFEALVLENSLIKHHMPKYNILLKDDKGYPFIRFDHTKEYPRFTLVGKVAKDGARYFGPFPSRHVTHAAIDAVSKALMLPTCSRKFPRDIGKERPCLNYQLGTCRGYCLKDVTREEYMAAVEQAVMVFEGRAGELAEKLRVQMEEAAENMRFELAAELRDRMKAVLALESDQHVWSIGKGDTDAVGFFREAKCCFVVLRYMEGRLLDKDYSLLEEPMEEDAEALSELCRQYYVNLGTAPKTVLIPYELPDREELEQFLTDLSGHKVTVTQPKRGDKRLLTETAMLNAKEEVQRATTREERITKTAQWLMDALELEKPPKRIESFDISNLGNENIVASMVVFVNGRPLKRDYRKFKIKTLTEQNDYGSMAEVIQRRFTRYREGDEKFSELPDILLIDGGAVHASVAQKAMRETGVDVPTFGMVKDDRHRTRALVTPEGREIGIDAKPYVFSFIGTIQEETHRFAIEYNRSLRSKKYGSSLDAIPGVGEKRRNDLIKAFKSVKAIENAGVEELNKVVPKPTAQKIYDHFHKEDNNDENN